MNGEERSCTREENAMIDDMHTIIASLRNYQGKPSEVDWKLRFDRTHGEPKVYMFGEEHTDVIGLIETLSEINSMLKRNDIILFEGGDRNSALIVNCGLERIYDIFVQWQFEKLGKSYNDIFSWNKHVHFRKLFESTKKSYDLTGLSIADAKCGYWDDGDAIRRSAADLSRISHYIAQRNTTMVAAIKDRLKTYDRVIINTGYGHMPLGDFIVSLRRNRKYYKAHPTVDLSDYYRLVDSERRAPTGTFKLEPDSGSSKVIYDYFKNERVPYFEAIHGKFLSNR